MRSLVDAQWVSRNLSRIITIDGSWHMPNTKRLAQQEFQQLCLPNARFFDIDQIADRSTGLPHMLPTGRMFAECMDAMKITNDDHIVVYDNRSDVYSAYRLYWTFRVFGHCKVSVLNGGMHQWLLHGNQRQPSAEFPVETGAAPLPPDFYNKQQQQQQNYDHHPRYKPDYQSPTVCNYQTVLRAQTDDRWQVIDARSAPRFQGTAAEPRPELIDSETRMLRSIEELTEIFQRKQIDINKPIICTCGSGVTASIVYFAAELLGAKQLGLYDGSWSEYAAKPESQIVVSAAL